MLAEWTYLDSSNSRMRLLTRSLFTDEWAFVSVDWGDYFLDIAECFAETSSAVIQALGEGVDMASRQAKHIRKRITNSPAGNLASAQMNFLEPRQLLSHVVFTVDSSQSSLSLTGTLAGATISEQLSGGLTDQFGGSIVAKLKESSIQFLSSNVSAEAQFSAAVPSGTRNANFAATASVMAQSENLALRNLSFNLTSIQIPISDGTFASSGESFSPAAGNFKYGVADAPASTDVLNGTAPASNALGTNSTLAIANGTMTLTVSLEGTFSSPASALGAGETASLTFTGQLVATAPVAVGVINQHGKLVVSGTSGNNDIALSVAGSNIELADFGIVAQTFPTSSVANGILVKAGKGNNQVRLAARLPAATVDGSTGASDTIIGNSAGDSLLGGAGNDSITANGGISTLKGGPGDDNLVVTGNDNEILGGAGDDTIHASSESGTGDTINGGAGDNTAYARKKFDTITNCTVVPT
jgi:RTX calcium-binding nonapeptide repeat (4 copies)